MNTKEKQIPVYSLHSFSRDSVSHLQFQVEVFDANRHFQVSYPHRHDFYEILYINNGSGIHIIDSNEYLIKPPCVFFLSPGQAHKLDLSHDIEGYIFLFTSEFYGLDNKDSNMLLQFPFFFSIEQNNPPLFLSNKDDKDFIESLFVRGCDMIRRLTEHTEETIRSILHLLLVSCNSLYPHQEKSEKSRGHILVKNFLLLIEENFKLNLRVNDYADKLAITPHHLTQIVKVYTGKTSTELLQEKLLLEIKKLLIHTNYSLSEIVEELHFSDQSYLTKFFKKHTGLSPSQYRKSIPLVRNT